MGGLLIHKADAVGPIRPHFEVRASPILTQKNFFKDQHNKRNERSLF